MRKLAIFLVIYFRNALKFITSVVTHEESGLGMIECSEVVGALNEKILQRNECTLLSKNVHKLESVELLMGQQMW